MGMKSKPKEDRVLLRLDDELDRIVRAKATLDHRQIQDELRHLIALGIDHEDLCETRAGEVDWQALGADMLGTKDRANRKASIGKTPIPASIRWTVWERDNFTCVACGKRTELCVDHINAESNGGDLSLENLQTLCRPCNSAKGTRANSAFLSGRKEVQA